MGLSGKINTVGEADEATLVQRVLHGAAAIIHPVQSSFRLRGLEFGHIGSRDRLGSSSELQSMQDAANLKTAH